MDYINTATYDPVTVSTISNTSVYDVDCKLHV